MAPQPALKFGCAISSRRAIAVMSTLRSPRRHARLESRDAREIPAGSRAIVYRRVESHWRPELRLAAFDAEIGRHDAHDRERTSVEIEPRADRISARAELALPQAMAEHDDVRPVRHVLIGRIHAAQFRRHAEDAEERRRGDRYRYLDRLVDAR